jgi:hypothetical protein
VRLLGLSADLERREVPLRARRARHSTADVNAILCSRQAHAAKTAANDVED